MDWCDENYLQLNVGKTKEMSTDFTRNQREYGEIKYRRNCRKSKRV